jgi:hypothetical protein
MCILLMIYLFFIELVSSESEECSNNEGFTMSRSTLYDIKKRYRESGNIDQAFKKKHCMTTGEDLEVISSIICCRDKNGNGMNRKEVVFMLMEFCNATTFKAVDNHYSYLVRCGKLPDLKRGGRVVKAQKTSTKRCCINVAQQLRWHGLIESVWAEQALHQMNFWKKEHISC